MPLVIVLALVSIVVMYLRFRSGRHLRDCRWREDRATGQCMCVTCGARLPCEKGVLPKVCLKGQDQPESENGSL